MKPETTLTTFENWTLRLRPGTGPRILLLLHGWTGDENSMWVFTRNFPTEYWILAPRAPNPTQPGGYSWRAPAPRGSWPTVDLFRPSITALLELVDHFAAANHLDAVPVDVAGFSQGAALTLTLGALHPDRVGKMGILAGFAPEGAEQVLTPGRLNGKNIFLAHGTLDEMVPIAMARRSIQLLESAGAQVTYSESEVAHKLSAEGLKALENYLRPLGS
jgi:phospholipase/carboxylesterase